MIVNSSRSSASIAAAIVKFLLHGTLEELESPACGCRETSLESSEPGSQVRTSGPAFLVSGNLVRQDGVELTGPAIIPPESAAHTAISPCQVTPKSHTLPPGGLSEQP